MPRPKSTPGAIVELVLIVGFAVGLALVIQAFVVKPYQIPTGSMIPTLEIGQRVLVQRVSYHFSDPEIGDIVVHPRAPIRLPAVACSRCRKAKRARSRSTRPTIRTS
jgi:signal peptidase I